MTRDAQTMMLVCTGVLFITVLIGGMFASNAASVWLRNRREERAAQEKAAKNRRDAQQDQERGGWLSLIEQKDAEIRSLNEMIRRLEKNYDIATRVLTAADRKEEKE